MSMKLLLNRAKFPLGRLVATPGAIGLGIDFADYIERHASGDWGEVCDEDKHCNDIALEEGARLLSAYTTPDGHKFWIITEADRSVTTALLPSEY